MALGSIGVRRIFFNVKAVSRLIDINYGPKMEPKCQIEDWQAGAGICSLAELARKLALDFFMSIELTPCAVLFLKHLRGAYISEIARIPPLTVG